jgi:predicted glycogen debranching enzyme
MDNEWLETDGNGGYACGTVHGERSRRYHGMLIHAAAPPVKRQVLVNGFEIWVTAENQRYPLTTQRYSPNTVYPDISATPFEFSAKPWPTWLFNLEGDLRIRFEIAISRQLGATVLRWDVVGSQTVQLYARPLISGRDHHSLHWENPHFNFDSMLQGHLVRWKPYQDIAQIAAASNGTFDSAPLWYRNFLYQEERNRGFDHVEDLASPGEFTWNLGNEPAVLGLKAENESGIFETTDPLKTVEDAFREEANRRMSFDSPVHCAADAYLVNRDKGKTIVAGYPWFGDWGRDTFIAVRGLYIATGQLETAGAVLKTWANELSEGMIPNCFPDDSGAPLFNSVDASLWFVIAAYDLGVAVREAGWSEDRIQSLDMLNEIDSILNAYRFGARYGIKMDDDGLLAHGNSNSQLTWMDARADGKPVTPRNGKAVEVQALWLNALRIGSEHSERWMPIFKKGLDSFRQRFWNEDAGCLYDVIDMDDEKGKVDASIRPNQIFAIGGLPFPVLDSSRAARMLNVIEKKLHTPLGLRTLSPEDSKYCTTYEGPPHQRDASYHQGTVWPWLMGPFIEGWLRVHDFDPSACDTAQRRFLEPLESHLGEAGLGHVSELADGDFPHSPKGCPFQAWSLGEYLRISRMLDDCATGQNLPRSTNDQVLTAAPVKEAHGV